MIWIAALGVAYGLTVMMSLPLRTLRYKDLFWPTLAFAFVCASLAFYFVPVPEQYTFALGILFALAGAALHYANRHIRRFEDKQERKPREAVDPGR